ncbi:hypothetical protein [Nocardiopsis sp. MG754419]|uniref:hypothetical protein n=1 Tax=Nocardiopsis sp. MG754419 TaxID=2259865 RepID=UPI001BA89EB9|nr:hypothetical protein [Nocardiopsis sp. MG754419]MBR8744488.1 hypothetical protein [Nocardiopsis sp. MG754419]
MRVINLTPHEVRVVDAQARVIRTWQSAPRPARVETDRVRLHVLDGIPLLSEERTRAANLPDPEDGVWYIVSSVVSSAHPERRDLLVPSDLVRDGKGVVTACRSFVITSGSAHEGAAARTPPRPPLPR